MIYCTGDIHGNVDELLDRLEEHRIPCEKDQVIVLLGDVGVNYFGNDLDQERKHKLQRSNRTYFCIHGNHEMCPEHIPTYLTEFMFDGIARIEPQFPNLIFAIDGETYNIEGLKTLVLGGAYSVDKWYRLRNRWHWFDDEQVSDEKMLEILLALKKSNDTFDAVFSHTCPLQWMPTDLFIPGIDQELVDNKTEEWLSVIEMFLSYRYWLFGHYHADRKINDKAHMLFDNVINLEFLKGE